MQISRNLPYGRGCGAIFQHGTHQANNRKTILNDAREKGKKGKIMTKTRRQPKSAAAGNRAGRSQQRFNYVNDNYSTPRSRRNYETNNRAHKSMRGFAAMDPKKRRRIASLGGRAFHHLPRGFAAMSAAQRRSVASQGGSAPHRRPRGFAAMRTSEQRAIAARGGRAPHRGPRGFAAMARRAQRAIAARGGRASHRH
jgi:hypothetical protein